MFVKWEFLEKLVLLCANEGNDLHILWRIENFLICHLLHKPMIYDLMCSFFFILFFLYIIYLKTHFFWSSQSGYKI